MIRTPSGKNLMNEQEAIQWLLDNNALPFQCTADYVGGAEIGLGTIVNPTPAKVRVGSLIFFADSKVSTVIAITSNSFICSDEYNDLVDDVVYVSNVQLNASGHLIVTLSNGTNIDAGLIKQITAFSINASQHLIASYNDGTSTDLGAIFSGNITVSGNLTVVGDISGTRITADSIIENMNNYAFNINAQTGITKEVIYAGACKNGNKLTLAIFGKITKTSLATDTWANLGVIGIPAAVLNRIIPTPLGWATDCVGAKDIGFYSSPTAKKTTNLVITKGSGNIVFSTYGIDTALDTDVEYQYRIEVTFLLGDNLAA